MIQSSVKIGCKSFRKSQYNPGNGVLIEKEQTLDALSFKIHKFNNRKRPDRNKIVIIPTFAEFGCESLIPLYCIPELLRNRFRGYYSIAVGWYGRDYLYKHLVDEFWELDEPYQHLRNYCLAFHNSSHNLRLLNEELSEIGIVVSDKEIGNIATHPKYLVCQKEGCNGTVNQFKDYQECFKCKLRYAKSGLFNNISYARRTALWVPMPSKDKLAFADAYLPPNPIGITARGRKTYGRNLTSDFYQKLINASRNLGFNPVWLGEKVTTIPCPDPTVPDFSRDDRARDLESTLALVSKLKFTIQFWTASTRLAGLVGTPFILFESPDQIWGGGQEGYRLELTSKGPKKLVVAHYLSVMENQDRAINVAERAMKEIDQKNYSTMMGVVENENVVNELIYNNRKRIYWF